MPHPPAQPLTFTPIFQERIWGGRALAELYGKELPAGATIGESWEIVDRPEAQSVVRSGAWAGRTLHDLWERERDEVFGHVPDAPRFPLLIKLLDAREKLSLQVHPPAALAEELGGEPKTEFWYITDAEPAAELYVGLTSGSNRETFGRAIASGTVEEQVHRVSVSAGDAMFLPSGRVHALGAGIVLMEIQQNSDTTYRVFDWNRVDKTGAARQLHVAESLRSIDFDDVEPGLVRPAGESLLRDRLFEIDRWLLAAPRPAGDPGRFVIVGCTSGAVECAGVTVRAGEFMLLPAMLGDRLLRPVAENTAVLRIASGGT
jgi:mannose-6-phosphate isomerase